MSDAEGLASWLQRNAAAVRADARRALEELVARGDLSEQEARSLEQAVEQAVGRTGRFVTENVLEPLRGLLGSLTAPRDGGRELEARLAALDARLERIERQLASALRDGEGGEPWS